MNNTIRIEAQCIRDDDLGVVLGDGETGRLWIACGHYRPGLAQFGSSISRNEMKKSQG